MGQPEKITADMLLDRLRARFDKPAFALLPLVRSNTGYTGQERYADALAMGLWPSRGLELHGFEVKVHRSDWLRELKQPKKAEPIWSFCNRWWIVVADKEIVAPGELPPTWGLMVPYGTGLRAIVEAPALTPSPPDLLFLAAILRRAQDVVTPESKLKETHKDGVKDGRKEAEDAMRNEREQHRELKTAVKAFEEASGVRINDWEGEKIGKAVRLVLDGKHIPTFNRLLEIRGIASHITTQLDGLLSRVDD